MVEQIIIQNTTRELQYFYRENTKLMGDRYEFGGGAQLRGFSLTWIPFSKQANTSNENLMFQFYEVFSITVLLQRKYQH